MKCDFYSLSDTGRVRANNEDAVVLAPDLGLVVLADGMGGYNAGEVAASLATQGVVQGLRPHLLPQLLGPREVRSLLLDSVEAANLSVYRSALERPEWHGMATTLVVAVFTGSRLTIGHVGDSRAYRFRQGQLVQLTRDHSLLQEQIDAGLVPAEMARTVQYKNLVTRAIGIAPVVDLDLGEHTVHAGDTYLVCSDGLSDMLTDLQMGHILRREKSLATAARVLLDEANAAGGRDNISLALVQCSPDTVRTAPSLLSRLISP